MPKLAPKSKCTGCMACHDVCPKNAIKIESIVDIPYPEIDTSICINCLRCEKVCPVLNKIEKNDIKFIDFYGGWSKDDYTRINGASGGAFGEIANGFFNSFNDAIVIGATLKNNNVFDISINSKDDIWKLQNSKYIQSDTSNIYRKTLAFLKQGNHVLFSGTPCQIAGLYGFLGIRKYDALLYTVDIVCHGVASREALQLHLKYHNSKHLYSFRNKTQGQYWYYSECTTINIRGQAVQLNRKDDTFFSIFSSWLTDRRSCSNCSYSTLPRIADISLADYWGGECDEKEFKKGVSLIIVNNIYGHELIDNCRGLNIFKSDIKSILKANPNIYCGYKFIQYHPVVIKSNFFYKIIPDRIRFNILINKMPWKLFWGIFKVVTIINNKIEFRKAIKKLEK